MAVAVVLAGLAWDLRRPPSSQWSVRAAIAGIRVYRATLSPLYDRLGVQCRFRPTCSHYAEAVMTRFGLVRGASLAAARIVRCGPWTAAGTDDPPPGR